MNSACVSVRYQGKKGFDVSLSAYIGLETVDTLSWKMALYSYYFFVIAKELLA